MNQAKKEFLEILEKDYKFNRENKIDFFQIMMLYFFSIAVPTLAINYLLVLPRTAMIAEYLICFFLVLMGVILFSISVFFTKFKIRINEKYGVYIKPEMISMIKKECSIDEIQEYYKTASYHFKKNILEKIIRDEISKNLDLKDENNINEILYEIKEKKEIKIKNV